MVRNISGRAFAAVVATFAFAACSDGGSDADRRDGPLDGGGDGGDGLGPLPFAPDPPTVYVAKAKNVLVGLPPTEAEVAAVQADPNALGGLIDGWMKLPQYGTKMLRFFELAFQQTQIVSGDYGDMLNPGQLQLDTNRGTAALMLENTQESFARTMLALNAEGRPFNEAMATRRFALTTALKVFYALLDVWQLDNAGKLTDRFQDANPTLQLYVTAAGPIPLAQTLDPSSPKYMHWYNPDVATIGGGAGCKTDPIVYPARANTLYNILVGALPGRKLANGTQCPGTVPNSATVGQLTLADFADWSVVDVRLPNPGEATTSFYDLGRLRSASSLVLSLPRVGFFTTPAFFANWQTNQSNQMRVTINQAFIVATGAQVDGVDPTVPSSTPGLDATHAANAECAHCHRLLDPSRSILAATYSWNYHAQLAAPFTSQPGRFVFEGVDQSVSSVADLGRLLATHPLTSSGWAQKLCYYVDSERCVPTDPELDKIVTLFERSNHSWNELVKAVLLSPITTHAFATKTATTNGEVVAVSRRDHLCAAYNARLGFEDVCGLDALTSNDVVPKSALAIVQGLPSDGYGRGSVAPVLPNEPTLFFRAGNENLCAAIAALVIDNPKPPPGAKTWSSAQSDAAIGDFVGTVMAIVPSDPRAPQLRALLDAHFAEAKVAAGATATSALQSTFVVACMSPSAVSMGM